MSLSDVFRALGDPTRRHILRMLAVRDMPAGEIANAFDMSKPSVSHHLAALKQAGLVRDLRRGQQIIYSLDSTVLQDALAWIYEIGGRGREGGGRG